MKALVRLLLAVTALASMPAAQATAGIRWGFDGRLVIGEFNPLTIEVVNPGKRPFEDTLVLTRTNGVSQRGARIVERVFVSAGGRRVVQMYPFATGGDSWALRWEHGGSISLPRVSYGRKAIVLLDDDSPLRGTLKGVRTFPARWFPPEPGANRCVSDIVLDHVPDWDAARRKAFLIWLETGGRLHLLPRAGAKLRFTGELDVLNEDAERFSVRGGRVIRYNRVRGELSVGGLLLSRRRVMRYEDLAALAPQTLEELKQSILPQHNWPAIFVLSLVFLALVGPVHWSFAKKRLDYRVSILALIAVIALFTYVFLEVGARGYGERAQVRTIGYARDLGNGMFDVTQYSNVFVTTGDLYKLAPAAESCLLSTAQINEAVPGAIDNGRGGSLTVDLPLFSSRSVLHRARLAARSFDLSVRRPKLPNRAPLATLVIEIDGSFPDSRDTYGIWAMYGNSVRPMRRDGNTLYAKSRSTTLRMFLRLDQLREMSGYYNDYGSVNSLSTVERRVLAEQLHVIEPVDEEDFTRANDHLSVFVLAKAPDSFALRGASGAQSSRVIYHIDVEK